MAAMARVRILGQRRRRIKNGPCRRLGASPCRSGARRPSIGPTLMVGRQGFAGEGHGDAPEPSALAGAERWVFRQIFTPSSRARPSGRLRACDRRGPGPDAFGEVPSEGRCHASRCGEASRSQPRRSCGTMGFRGDGRCASSHRFLVVIFWDTGIIKVCSRTINGVENKILAGWKMQNQCFRCIFCIRPPLAYGSLWGAGLIRIYIYIYIYIP